MEETLTVPSENGGLEDVADQLLKQLVDAHGMEAAMRSLALRSGYEDIPPTIDEFIDDPDFIGTMVGKRLFPPWRVGLREIFPNPYNSPYQEITLTGAIGTGKTTFAMIGSLYDLCKILHLKDPHETYGLVRSDPIIYVLVNATKALSEGVLYEQMIAWIEQSKYFRSLIDSAGGKTTKRGSLFPNNVDIVSGSRFDQMMGRAIMGSILDELNFQTKVSNQAYDNYNSIKARIESRFLKKHGKLPAHMWLVSSKSNDTGWLQNHIETALTSPKSRVFDNPLWDILKYKRRGFYSGKKFTIFIGDEKRDPFIIDNARETVGISPENLIEVPIEHKQNFINDIHRALQDLAGISTRSSFQFLSSVELIEECQIRPNPVTMETIELDINDYDQALIDYLDFDNIISSSQPRFIHFDIGLKKDALGIASSRFGGQVTLKKTDILTGNVSNVKEPIYLTDFIMRVVPRPGQDIAFYKLRNFVHDLKRKGYPIGSISTDGYQSENLRQDLTLAGYDCQLVSVDKTRNPYELLKQVILEGRYNSVKHKTFNREMGKLLDIGDKIDHPTKGSKDVADGVCGSIWNTYQHYDKYFNMMSADEFVSSFEKYMVKEENIYELLARQQSRSVRQVII